MAFYKNRYGRFYRKGRFSGGYARGRYGGRVGFRAGRFGLSLSMPFLVGAAIGMTNLDNMIPPWVKILAACAPVRGLGPIKAVAQGMLVGDVVQSMTGFSIPVGGASGSGVTV